MKSNSLQLKVKSHNKTYNFRGDRNVLSPYILVTPIHVESLIMTYLVWERCSKLKENLDFILALLQIRNFPLKKKND